MKIFGRQGQVGASSILPGKITAILFFGLLVFIIIYKSIHVPITFDEKGTALVYPRFTPWQIMMYPDNWPSNHILNSLGIKVSEYFFGIESWSVRLPSMLSFLLFYGVLYLLALQYFRQTWVLFCVPFFVMFCNPYLLDFYSLARGYGMSNAFLACSIYALLRYPSSFSVRWYFTAIVFAMLAAYANFTLLIFWVAVQLLLTILQMVVAPAGERPLRKNIALALGTALLAAAFLALCYVPIHKMQSTNQFTYWSKQGFFKDTLVNELCQFSYADYYFHISDEVMAKWLIALVALTSAYALYKVIRRRAALSDPLVVVLLLLWLVWLVNMTQVFLLGTPFLSGRTALSYYVLFAFVLMFLLRDLQQHIRWLGYSLTPALVLLFIFHFGRTVSLNYLREWYFNANTFTVLNYVNDYRQKHDLKSIGLNTNALFNPSFGFYSLTGKTPWLSLTDYHSETDTASKTTFYYTTENEAGQLKNYSPVLSLPKSNSVLLMRKDADN